MFLGNVDTQVTLLHIANKILICGVSAKKTPKTEKNSSAFEFSKVEVKN